MRAEELLTERNLDDLVSSFGWQTLPLPARILRRVFRSPAAKFARMMLAFDDAVGKSTLAEGAAHILKDFAQGLDVVGFDNIPKSGPALFLSNHPGMVDTLALFNAINRPDLRIIALDRPFLQSLPNIASHLFFVSENPGERLRVVRQAASHLRAGGALLTFPAGQIEPDPAVYPGALQSLSDWTESAGIFLRFAPDARIVPVLVSGVLWDRAVKFPLTKLKATREEREKMGAALQLLAHIILNARPLRIRTRFARPITLEEIGSSDMATAHKKIIERMRDLLQDSDRSPHEK